MLAVSFSLNEGTRSRYLRTSWQLVAHEPIQLSDAVSILPISEGHAERIAETIRRKNVFARHSGERHFYLERALGLAGRTVIEIFASGDPKSTADSAAIEATLVEQLLVLSSTFWLDRARLQRKLAVSIKPRDEIEFVIGPRFHFIRSRKRGSTRPGLGLSVDKKLVGAFKRLGLAKLLKQESRSKIEATVVAALGWLYQSRTEADVAAAVVKTAIAVETLLIFSESESLAQSLSERIAFVVGRNIAERQLLSRIIKRFYEVRSGIVHGGKRRQKYLSHEMLEIADRLVFTAALTILDARNSWTTPDDVRVWCEDQRWAKDLFNQHSPISRRNLDKLLAAAASVIAPQ